MFHRSPKRQINRLSAFRCRDEEAGAQQAEEVVKFAQLAKKCEWQNVNGRSLALKPMPMALLYPNSAERSVSRCVWGAL